MKDIKKILIVCTGNSCRSIMAEGYLVKRLKSMEKGDTLVTSAGTGAISGVSPTEETIQTMKEENIDVSGYMSSSLNKTELENADIILVMEDMHKDRILNIAPEAEGKIYLLRSFSKEGTSHGNSISDPIGKPLEFYGEVFKIIKSSIEGFLEWLKE